MKKSVFEGKLYEWMRIISQVVTLNFIWLFTSIPLVTAGVSSAALYDTIVSVVLPDGNHPFRYYFKAFGRHLWRCLLPGIIFLLYLGVMVLDCYQGLYTEEFHLLPLSAWLVIAVFLMTFYYYLFAVLSQGKLGFVESLSVVIGIMLKRKRVTGILVGVSALALICGVIYFPCVSLLPGALGLVVAKLLSPEM